MGTLAQIPRCAAEALVHDDVLIDYLTFTVDDPNVMDILGVGQFRPAPSPRGYSYALEDDTGAVFAQRSRADPSLRVEMSGRALASRRNHAGDEDLLESLAPLAVRASRVDLARDTSGELTPSWLRDCMETERYTSSIRTRTSLSEFAESEPTIYIGKRTSNRSLAVYDKSAELRTRQQAVHLERLTRWELRHRGVPARCLLADLVAVEPRLDLTTGETTWNYHGVFSVHLGRILRVTARPVDRQHRNYGRAGTDPDWSEFIATATGTVLTDVTRRRDPEIAIIAYTSWLRRAAAPGVAAVSEILGPAGVEKLIADGRTRINPELRSLRDSDPELVRRAMAEALDLPLELQGGSHVSS